MTIALGTRPRAIVMVLSDDMPFGWHLDPLTMPKFQTRLAAEANWLNLPNLMLSTPTCGPSRAAMLLGRRSDHTGATSNATTHLQITWSEMISNWFQAAGIRTGLTGKIMNGWQVTATPGPPTMPPGWDYVWATGDSDYTGFKALNTDGSQSTYAGNDTSNYQIDVCSAKAQDFINTYGSSNPADPPIFLWCTPVAPHDPFTPAARHNGATVTPYTARPSVAQTDVSTQPAWVQALSQFTTAQYNNVTGTQVNQARRCMRSLDDLLDDLINLLISKGIYDDTLLVFMTDNGNAFGRFHRLASINETAKSSNYPEMIRASCMIHWPGATGRTIPNVCSSLDLTATFCDLVGITPPSGIALDGVSLAPLLVGTPNPSPKTYIESCVRHTDANTSIWWGLNTDDGYIYTEHYASVAAAGNGSAPIDVELYVPADTDAQVNVAADPAQATRVANFHQLLAQRKARSEGQGRRGPGAPFIRLSG